jgi:hypothetical protein
VVVDHDAGRLVWAAPGHDATTLGRLLRRPRPGPLPAAAAGQRRRPPDRDRGGRALPPHKALPGPLPRRPSGPPTHSTRCAARSGTRPARAGRLPWRASAKVPALRCGRNPGDLTARQRAKLAWIARVNDRLDRADLLKEEPGAGGHAQGCAGHRAPGGVAGLAPGAAASPPSWSWPRRSPGTGPTSRPPSPKACPTAPSRPSTPRSACPSRVGFGFKSPQALIALATLSLGGLCPSLPGRG